MKALTIITTYICNMKCPFCLFYEHKTRFIDLNLFKKIIKEAKLLGYDTIALTGGEPCMHPMFDELIEAITNENLDFWIVSNGFNYEKYAALLKKHKKNFRHITFSLDSYKEDVHDKLRTKGSYKKVIAAIKFFTENGIDVKVSICLNKLNYKDIESHVYFLDKLKVKDIRFLSVIPTEKNKAFVLTDKERAECCETINKLRNKVNIKLRIMSSLNTAEGINFCSALDLSGLAVNPDGKLIFCCDINEEGAVLGSLKKEKLSDLIKKSHEVSNYLKEKRKMHLYTNAFFEGFNTCFFCNKYLKEKMSNNG